LLIETPDGLLVTHRFKDTEPRSILERIARPLIEAPAEREMREAMQTALQHQQSQLTGDLEKSRAYYEAAREMVDSISIERNNVVLRSRLGRGVQQRKEKNIEISPECVTNKERRKLSPGLLDPQGGSAPTRHASHDNSDHSREAATHAPDAPAIGVGRGR